MNRDLWLSALAASGPVCDPDALTSTEIGQLLGLKPTATKVRIQKLMASGALRSTAKRVLDASGRPHTVQAYVLLKSEDACVPPPRATPKPSTAQRLMTQRLSQTSTSKH